MTEEKKDVRYNDPKGNHTASEELITKTIEETEIYKRAKELILNAQRSQVGYGLDKYPEPLNADTWTATETIDHIIQEAVDKLHYLAMFRIKLEGEDPEVLDDIPSSLSIVPVLSPNMIRGSLKLTPISNTPKPRVDIMVDIETLGTDPDSTIFQIAAVAFDITTGMKYSSFEKVADICENEPYEMNVSGSTLKWWLDMDADLLKKILNKGSGSSADLLTDFHEWLKGAGFNGELYLWGNGILFDNNMIRTQFTQIGLDYPIKYANDRDVRTIVDLACAKLGATVGELRDNWYDRTLKAHDAYNDVCNQITMVCNCYSILSDRAATMEFKEVSNDNS